MLLATVYIMDNLEYWILIPLKWPSVSTEVLRFDTTLCLLKEYVCEFMKFT